MRMFLLLLLACAFAGGVLAQETITVNVSGLGATPEAAEKAALINAVQQAVGLYLDSETLIRNEQVVFDSILSLSDGFVTKYDVKSAPRKRISDGLFETTITAVVQKGKVGAELKRRNLIQGVDSKDAWAEAVTSVKSAQDAVEILKRRVPDMVTALLIACLVDNKGFANNQVRPEVKPDPNTGHAWCGWNIAVGYDRNAYYQKAVPLLQKAFNAIADRSLSDFTVKAPVSMQINRMPGQPSYMRHTAILGTPVRFPDRLDFIWPKLQSPDDIIVCLNYASDKSRQNLRFHAWVLNGALYKKWLQSIFTPRSLRLSFIDERGATVVEDTIELSKGTLLVPIAHETPPEHGFRQGVTGPNASPAQVFESPLAYWGTPHDMAEADGYSGKVLWITPDFRALWVSIGGMLSVSPYLDNLLIHHETSLDPDDIKKLNAVRFSIVPK